MNFAPYIPMAKARGFTALLTKVLCYQNENKIIGERKIDTSKNTLV